MSQFDLPSGAGFSDAEKIGKYLTTQLGSGYKFDHQEDKLAETFGGRRGALGRWLNESVFGDMSVVLSNNPLFGAAIRFYLQGSRTQLVVHGIVPNPTLRKIVFPCLGMVLGIGALVGLQNAVGLAIFFGWLPIYLMIPRLFALPLTGKIGRMLNDAEACRAAGIDPPPVSELASLTPAQAGQFRVLGLVGIVLGLVISVGTTIWAMAEFARPYASRGETLFLFSTACGFGLMWVYVGISRWSMRRVGWLKCAVALVLFGGLCAGAGAIVSSQVTAPAKPSLDVMPQAGPIVDKNTVDKNKE